MIAFFDFDDTLMCGDSILYWNCFLFEVKPQLRKHRWIVYLGLVLWCLKIISTHTLKRFPLKATSYLRDEERSELASRFVREVLPKFLYPEMIARMQGHSAAGHRVVVVSASADFYMNQKMMSQILPCDEVVGTEMEFPAKGLFRVPRYASTNFKGPRKVEMLRALPQFPDVDVVPDSYGYSDHYSDRFLLEYTQFPQAVHPDAALEVHAREKNWPICRPFRLKNGRSRSLWKLKMLVFAKGMDHNQVPTGLAWRSQMLGLWFEAWKSWVLGDGEWDEFWYLSQTLKGGPIELALEEIWLRHESLSLPFIPTAQYIEKDNLSQGSYLVGEILPYSTWRRLKDEFQQGSFDEVKIPVPGVREMMALDCRFIENSLKLNGVPGLSWNDFFEARVERHSQLLKKDYQAEKEMVWMKNLSSSSLPKQLCFLDFKILEVGRELVLTRASQSGINFRYQVESRLVDLNILDEFLLLMKESLAKEVITEFRFGQVWRYVAGDWLVLDPNALYPAVAGAGNSFCNWLEDPSNFEKRSCFEGVDFNVLARYSGDALILLQKIFAPILEVKGLADSWSFYHSVSKSELEDYLGALNPFCFDIAMNLVELKECRMKLIPADQVTQ